MAVEKGSCHSMLGIFLRKVAHLHRAPARWVLAPGQSFGKNHASRKNLTPLSLFFQGCPYGLAQLVPCSSWGWSTASLCWPAACSSSVAHYCPGAQSGQLLSAQLLVETLGGLVLGSASSFPSPEQQPKQLVLLSFPGYLPSHVVQHILFPTHMAFGQMCSAAQRELRKSSFSPKLVAPSFSLLHSSPKYSFFSPLPL